jgi:hypothetical protein
MEDEFMLRSTISMSVSAALLLGMVSITGCGSNNAARGTNVHTQSVRQTHDGRIGVNSVRGGMRVNTVDKMEMSQALADRIAAMPEVRSANVVLLGKSAYVAVTLDKKPAAGPHAKSTTHYNARTSTPHSYGAGTGRTLTGTDGTMRGTDGAMTGTNNIMRGIGSALTGTDRTMRGTDGAMTGTDRTMRGTGRTMTGTTGTGLGSRDSLVDGNGAKRDVDMGLGRGLRARSTAPSNSTTTTEDEITKEMKAKIADEVKKNAPQIDAVYVSANPDFVERVNVYAKEARAGHPLKGFVDEFRIMVERIFPTRSDTK